MLNYYSRFASIAPDNRGNIKKINHMIRVLLTSTSFQDTPGRHHDLLSETGFEVTRLRGPLSKEEMLQHVVKFDALLCGDDHIDREVIDRGREGRLKVISKYGVGLDKLDAHYARSI